MKTGLDLNQQDIVYGALLKLLRASGVINKDAFTDWPMLICIAEEYADHLETEKVKPTLDLEQIYYCDTGAMDKLVVYPSETESGEYPTVSFVTESTYGQSVNKVSAILVMDDVRRLRNQLNQVLGEDCADNLDSSKSYYCEQLKKLLEE